MSYFVSFYRFASGDCSKNGLSNCFTNAYVIKESEIGNDLPENTLVLIKRELFGRNADYLVPLDLYDADKHCSLPVMFGGNYAMGDSRFCDEVSRLPLPVHDRVESWEEYDLYSK